MVLTGSHVHFFECGSCPRLGKGLSHFLLTVEYVADGSMFMMFLIKYYGVEARFPISVRCFRFVVCIVTSFC